MQGMLSQKTSPWLSSDGPSRRKLTLIAAGSDCCRLITRACSERSWQLLVLADVSEVASLDSSDVVLVDVCSDGLPQIDRIKAARRAAPNSVVVAMTAYPSLSLAVAVMRAGADNCVTVPVHPRELLIIMEGNVSAPENTLPSLARIEWDYIARVLELAQGNISRAAKTLGIQRSTLQRKLKKYPPVW
jgi:two-component system response regulator RegA